MMTSPSLQQPPQDMTDAVYGGPLEFGMDPPIQSIDRGYIKVDHKAKFKKVCCDHCNYSLNRKYFSVLENSYEYNHPMGCHLLCFVLPPNCFCPGFDCITKRYYDRGIYDTQHWKWRVGCLQGDPSLHANERRITCFRMACPKFCNQFMECYTPYLCGERLRVVPQETCCYCCSNRASWCTNFCGLCGYIDGEPLAISPCAFVGSLIDGEAVKLLYSMSSSRARWLQKSSSSR